MKYIQENLDHIINNHILCLYELKGNNYYIGFLTPNNMLLPLNTAQNSPICLNPITAIKRIISIHNWVVLFQSKNYELDFFEIVDLCHKAGHEII